MTILNETSSAGPGKIYQMDSGNAVLSSWKEIARYVGKGVRTVQRWEKEQGLPVRRTKHTTKSTVLGVPSEIDEWVRSQQFADGRNDADPTERRALLQHIEALEAEISELRRQLQTECAKSA